MIQKFRKKPVVIEAIRLGWQTWGEVCEWLPREIFGGGVYLDENGVPVEGETVTAYMGLYINTLEGKMLARGNKVGEPGGDWIIKGVKGEFYPCKPDIFEATYELIES
jgi:hypothetical protein